MGLPGAGKSTLAAGLAAAMHWPVIDRDALRAGLFPQALGTAQEKDAANAATFAAVEASLARGRSCIVDGMSFADADQRDALRRLARRGDARCIFLWLDCPVPVAVRRVARQTEHRAVDRVPGLVVEVAARFAPPGADALRLDATESAEALLRAALARLSAESRG